MTTAYFKPAKARVQDVKANTVPSPKKASIPQPAESVSADETYESIFDALNLPSAKRILVSLVAGLFAGACTAYLGTSLTAYLAVGAALLTGSAFLTFLCLFVGYALTILASMLLSGKVLTFVLLGEVDRCYKKVSMSVADVFGSFKNKFTWSAS